MSVSIIQFEPKYAKSFKDLNITWLEKYFYVEPKDEILLDNCQESIIEKGGHIYLARHQGQIVGCFSLLKLNEKEFELGKMAVVEDFQGLKIGQCLLEFAIDFGRRNKWDKILLYSSTKLDAALHIYRKYGFREVDLEKELPYARSDIKMELDLNER